MKRSTNWIPFGLLTIAVLLVSSETFAAGTNDHFESRRREAERQQAAQQQQQLALRPWGGPTTGRQFWRQVPERQFRFHVGTPHHHHPHHHHQNGAVFIPGGYRWVGGRLVYIPPYYQYFGGAQHIHIEQHIEAP